MDKIKFLTELNTLELVSYIMEEYNVEYDKAIDMLYNSQIFEKLLDSETGLYFQSSSYIFELFKYEYKTGKIFNEQ